MTATSRICALVLVAGTVTACTGAPPAPRPAPTRELVVWVDRLCESQTRLANLQERSAEDVADITAPEGRVPLDQEFHVSSYLFSVSSQFESLAEAFDEPPTSGIDAADRLRAGYAAALDGVQPEIEQLSDTFTRFQRSPDDLVRDAMRVGELIASLAPPQPDLAAVLATEPALADAHALAPRCTPAPPAVSPSGPSAGAVPTSAGPLPTAADGTDVGSCADGACQILVTGPVDVPVRDTVLEISLRESGGVTLRQRSEGGGYSEADLSGGGTASLGSRGGPTITVSLDGSSADGAVLRIATAG